MIVNRISYHIEVDQIMLMPQRVVYHQNLYFSVIFSRVSFEWSSKLLVFKKLLSAIYLPRLEEGPILLKASRTEFRIAP